MLAKYFDTKQRSTTTLGTDKRVGKISRTDLRTSLLRNPNWKYENMTGEGKYELENTYMEQENETELT